MIDHKPCPFCTLPKERIIESNDHGLVIRDGFPISEGHTLIIPKRHIGSFFETTQVEKLALLDLLNKAQITLKNEFNPPSFNIGINDGKEAGQTVPHLHIHLIPRYEGDTADPRGGVRNILPDKSGYLNKTIDVVAGVIKKNGKFLIARRAKHKHMGGFWEYAGGKVEEGESDEESLQRELHEEFGISVQVKQHLLNSFFRYEKINVNLKAYLVEHLSGEFILRDHDAICWITPEEFKDYEFAPADVPFNEYIIQHGI